MPLDRRKLALVHLAATRLGMDEAGYRAVLMRAAGVESASELTAEGFAGVMDEFRRLGFQSTASKQAFGARGGMASTGQVWLIRGLWSAYTEGEGDDRSLGRWLRRTFKVEALRFLDSARASRAIDALKKMAARKGVRPTGAGDAPAP